LELLIIPFALGLISFLVPKNNIRFFGLIGSIVPVILTCIHLMDYVPGTWIELYRCHEEIPFGLTFTLHYDGISLLMLLLTAFSFPLIFLSNFNRESSESNLFHALAFFMQTGLFGVFLAGDGVLFYIFWEFTLIPIFLILYWFGNGNYTTLVKFFIYTMLGSLAMLLSLIWLKQHAHSFAYGDLIAANLTEKEGFWIMFGFILAFAIKIPLFPFHTWQPNTYSSAPMAGTMLLSALMLKMALFGMIKWMIPLAPEGLECMQWIVIILGVLGIIYGGVIAIKQTDIKKIFAYASISHLGLIAAGIMLFSQNALTASMIQLINHSILSIGLFLIAEILISRTGTQDITQMGGIAEKAPKFAFWFMIISFASVSIPFSAGFIGEFLLLREISEFKLSLGILAASTLVFGAVYMFRAYQITMSGHKENLQFTDLTWNEWLVFCVLGILALVFGLAPYLIGDLIKESAEQLTLIVQNNS
jgi:NADH-quinone oxidoreductase subunit M